MSGVPKAELHVHLEGTAPPELVARIAARNGLDLPERLLGTDGRFRYTDFLDFLRTYDLAASVIRTGDDYRDITYEYLCACARDRSAARPRGTQAGGALRRNRRAERARARNFAARSREGGSR